MLFEAVSPELQPTRPFSQAIQTWQSAIHALHSPNGRTLIRSQFGITDWLLVGSCLQALLILISPFPPAAAFTPLFALASYKIVKTFLITNGIVANPHMKNVHLGRTTAIFPEADGSFNREKGDTFGGDGVCIMILSTKCNHPLGMFYPPYQQLTNHAKTMFEDLETNPNEYGFLGVSSYNSTGDTTKPELMSIMYFRSMEHVHKFVASKSHRAGWDWWNKAKVESITISHEVYDVPNGNWENVYVNSKPTGFAATSHAIKSAGTEIKWACPIIDAKRMNHKQRMEPIKA